jgi:hypothetical protein
MDAPQAEARSLIEQDEDIYRYIHGRSIVKGIYVPGRIYSILAK